MLSWYPLIAFLLVSAIPILSYDIRVQDDFVGHTDAPLLCKLGKFT